MELTNKIFLGTISVRGPGVSDFYDLKLIRFLIFNGLASDPTTTSWGTAEEGRLWYNKTSHVFKYWDGSNIKTIATV